MDIKSFIAGLQAGTGSGGAGADVLSSLIDRSITEIESDETSIGAYAFAECDKLTRAHFSKAVSVGKYAFYACNALAEVSFPNATSIGNQAFMDSSLITSVYFPNATSMGNQAFTSNVNLPRADFPKVMGIPYQGFYNCNHLESINLPKVTSIASQAFSSCTRLKAVILRSESLCTLSNKDAFNYCYRILGTKNSVVNPNGDKCGYFYVPSALVDSYKSATNWSTYATQFRALEDYTVDGTITGELDPSKI